MQDCNRAVLFKIIFFLQYSKQFNTRNCFKHFLAEFLSKNFNCYKTVILQQPLGLPHMIAHQWMKKTKKNQACRILCGYFMFLCHICVNYKTTHQSLLIDCSRNAFSQNKHRNNRVLLYKIALKILYVQEVVFIIWQNTRLTTDMLIYA